MEVTRAKAIVDSVWRHMQSSTEEYTKEEREEIKAWWDKLPGTYTFASAIGSMAEGKALPEVTIWRVVEYKFWGNDCHRNLGYRHEQADADALKLARYRDGRDIRVRPMECSKALADELVKFAGDPDL